MSPPATARVKVVATAVPGCARGQPQLGAVLGISLIDLRGSRSASDSLADAAVLLRTAGGACGSRPAAEMSTEVSGEAEGVTLIEAIAG